MAPPSPGFAPGRLPTATELTLKRWLGYRPASTTMCRWEANLKARNYALTVAAVQAKEERIRGLTRPGQASRSRVMIQKKGGRR